MKSLDRRIFAALTILVLALLPGCELVGGIFKAGFGMGVIAVIAVLVIIVWMVTRARK